MALRKFLDKRSVQAAILILAVILLILGIPKNQDTINKNIKNDNMANSITGASNIAELNIK